MLNTSALSCFPNQQTKKLLRTICSEKRVNPVGGNIPFVCHFYAPQFISVAATKYTSRYNERSDTYVSH